MLHLRKIHHVAIIASDYQASKRFYTEVLGLTIIQETFREERNSYKLDLALNDDYQVELFSFDDAPPRLSYPEACGLRHLAFEVDDVAAARQWLLSKGVAAQEVRIDPVTEKKFVFFTDPDQQPLELYER